VEGGGVRESKSASLGQLRSYSSDDDDGDDGENVAPSKQAGKKSRWNLGSVLRTTLFTLRQHARHVSVRTTNQNLPASNLGRCDGDALGVLRDFHAG
jgi:hypothetical protein